MPCQLMVKYEAGTDILSGCGFTFFSGFVKVTLRKRENKR